MRSETNPSGQQTRRTFIETARRAQIMAAAIDTIAELGYGQASLTNIAKRAGTSKGVILYHFDGKDELISEVLTELIARAAESMGPRIEAEQTGAGKLRAYIEGNIALVHQHRNHVIAIVEIALNARAADGSRLFDAARVEAGVAVLRGLLAAFQGTGEFRADFDPQVVALAIRGAIDTVLPRLALMPELDVDHHARELADLFVHAVRAGGAGPDASHPSRTQEDR
jgi:TetR/AcrR family transcriptional regulator, fatty acid metabolism regulator protein